MAVEQNILVEYIQILVRQFSFSFEIMKNEMPKKVICYGYNNPAQRNDMLLAGLCIILIFHSHEMSHATSSVLLHLLNSNFRQR